MSAPTPHVSGEPLIEVVRSGVVESVHTGHVVLLGPAGELVARRGRPEVPVFWRSAAKPLQATAVARADLPLDPGQLAMAASSHSGEPEHVATVLRTLAGGGLVEDDLGCPPDWPIDDVAHAHARAAGGGPRRVYMNCSGKHAALLRLCVAQGWPTAGYLHVDHPLQRLLLRTVTDLAGEAPAATAVDGCGLPLYALSLDALAGAFATLADGPVAGAMRAHPLLVAGTHRLTTRLLRAVPGLLVKDGAEGVYAAALPGVGAVAVKVDDGALRAAEALVIAGLRALGVGAGLPDDEPVLGGGAPVGTVRVRPGALPA